MIIESITDVSNMIISDLGKRGFEYTESNRKSLENKIATFNNYSLQIKRRFKFRKMRRFDRVNFEIFPNWVHDCLGSLI